MEATDQQSCRDRLLAQIQEELLQCHRLIVNADYKVAKLGQEELDVLVGKLAELVAEDIVDADMVRVASIRCRATCISIQHTCMAMAVQLNTGPLTRGKIPRGRGPG